MTQLPRMLWIAALVGCATAPVKPAQAPLTGTVALTEVTASGERIAITGDGLADVDINSRIEVHVDRATVQDLFQREDHVDAAEVQRVKTKLTQLDDLTRRQQQVVQQLVDLSTAWIKQGKPSVPSVDLQQAVQQFRKAQGPLNEAIQRYAIAAGQPPGDTYFAGDTAATYQALDDERQKVLAQAAALATSSGLRWRMQAELAQGAPIHLPNYDTYPDGTFTVVNKLAPQVTLKEISTQLDEAKQLAKDVKDLSGLEGTLVKSGLAAVQDLLASLEAAAQGDLAVLEPVVKAIPAAALQVKEVAAVKTQLDGLAPTLTAIKTGCAPILDAIEKASLGGVTVAQGEACLRAIQQHGPDLLNQARAAEPAARALIDLVTKTPGKLGGLIQPVRGLVPKLQIVVALKQWADTAGKGLDELGQFLQLTTAAAATTWTSDKQTDPMFAELTDTVIDLRRTERKEGDLLYFRPSIVKQDGSASVVGATTDMRVARMGMYLDVSAAVGFTDRRDHHWGPFSAAPGVVAAVHYRARPDSGAARMFNAIQPGIGLHFLYPDLGSRVVNAMGVATASDPSFELGLGGTVTLFGDLLQVGAGYDLQVSTSYWYIGFGLGTLAKLGVRLSPGS